MESQKWDPRESFLLPLSWFIYLQDRQFGPFSWDEIQDQLKKGNITKKTQVWRRGMVSWTALCEVEAFSGSGSGSGSGPNRFWQRGFLGPFWEIVAGFWRILMCGLVLCGVFGLMFLFCLWIFAGDWKQRCEKVFCKVVHPYHDQFLSLVSHMPALSPLLCPILIPDGVSPLDLEGLKAAASFPVWQKSKHFAMLVPKPFQKTVSIFVAGNVEDGTCLDLQVRAIPETLERAIRLENKELLTKDRYGVTFQGRIAELKNLTMFRQSSGFIPGQYLLILRNLPRMGQELAEDQLGHCKSSLGLEAFADSPIHLSPTLNDYPQEQVLAVQPIFLGGVADSAYEIKLKKRLDDEKRQLKKAAQRDKAELEQLFAALAHQYQFIYDWTHSKSIPISLRSHQIARWEAFHKSLAMSYFKDFDQTKIADQRWITAYGLHFQLAQLFDCSRPFVKKKVASVSACAAEAHAVGARLAELRQKLKSE
jgi:hypothetical protein